MSTVTVASGSSYTADALLSLAASLERSSEHPLARAIVQAANEKKLPLAEGEKFQATPGGGIEGTLLGKNVIVGTERFLERARWSCSLAAFAAALPDESATRVYVAVNGKTEGLIGLADQIKSSAAEASRELRRRDCAS